MRKTMYLVLVVMMVLIVGGCKEKTEQVEIEIVVQNGKGRITQFYMEYTHPIIGDNVEYNVNFLDYYDSLKQAIENEIYEIVYAPLDLGAKSYINEGNYTLAATVIMGDTFVVSNNEVLDDWASLEGKDIYVYNEGIQAMIILETLLNMQEYDTPPTIEFVDADTELIQMLQAQEDAIVVLEEPLMNYVSSDSTSYHFFSLQDQWKDETGFAYPDFGIFVHDDISNELKEAYLREVQISILEYETNIDDMIEVTDGMNSVILSDEWIETIVDYGIVYHEADDAKEMVENYLEFVIEYDEDIIGEVLPENGFYN